MKRRCICAEEEEEAESPWRRWGLGEEAELRLKDPRRS